MMAGLPGVRQTEARARADCAREQLGKSLISQVLSRAFGIPRVCQDESDNRCADAGGVEARV